MDLLKMDPWRDCERLYDPHFMDRMNERHLPRAQVEEAIIFGKKIRKKENDFDVKWNKWTIKLIRNPCFLFLKTAFKHEN